MSAIREYMLNNKKDTITYDIIKDANTEDIVVFMHYLEQNKVYRFKIPDVVDNENAILFLTQYVFRVEYLVTYDTNYSEKYIYDTI